MNYGPLVFLAAFLALAASWFGLVLTPQIQIGRQQQETNTVNTAELYPTTRPGEANQGLQVYRANGCFYCHSQQVGQTGAEINVILSSTGTNPVAVAEALLKANAGVSSANAAGLSAGLPKTILHGVEMNVAKTAANALKAAGAEANIKVLSVGPDISRGWGKRRSVAQDFLYDDPVMLGSLRIGPDLANVGTRWPANWELMHLYQPRSVVNDSPMPSYRFLFERRKIERQPSPDALQLPKEFAPVPGFEIVPRPEAKALVAYLLSLHAAAPLFEAPVSAPHVPAAAAATNSLAK
jgi:cbb3-type cytochrome oxidase cytochrome c subunit